MSVKVMSLVWEGFPGSGSDLLVMLAMADWCNDTGGSLFPSMRMVAEKIRVGEKQARRIVQALEQDGYLTVVGNANGGAPGTTKQFRMNVEKLKALADAKVQTPPANVTPPLEVTPPMQGHTTPLYGRGTAPMGVPEGSHAGGERAPTHGSLTTNEPSINHQEEKSAVAPVVPKVIDPPVAKPEGVDGQVWKDFLVLRKSKRAHLTETALDGIRKEATKAGMSMPDVLAMCCMRGWAGFEAKWLKDQERGSMQSTGETPWQRSMRERAAEFSPSIARRAPGSPVPVDFIDEVRDVPSLPSR